VLTVPISTTGCSAITCGDRLCGIVTIVLISWRRASCLGPLGGRDYQDWKNLKRFIGIFFILAFFHSLTVKALDAKVAITWVMLFFIIGTASYLYTEVFGVLFRQQLPYHVQAVKHPNNSSTEVTLRAQKQPIRKHRAGQFLFVRFPGGKGLNESHPFTISSAPAEEVLRLTIKACGNFTRDLFGSLKAGAGAVVEGPFGMFDYKTGGPRQIWIAGGIGLTPFLSFVRHDGNQLVWTYYTVRHPEEAIFVDRLEAVVITPAGPAVTPPGFR
jgi:predicted ferric reductase